MPRRAWRSWLRDTRGASLTEYLILVGTIALAALAGAAALGRRTRAKAAAEAECVQDLSRCGGADGSAVTAADSLDGPKTGSAAASSRAEPTASPAPPNAATAVKKTAAPADSNPPLGIVADFIRGAVAGDFAEGGGWSSFVGQVVVGFIPWVGQAADLRDSTAALKNFKQGRPGSGIGLLAAGVAWVPGFGDAAKGLVRGAERVEGRALKEAVEEAVKEGEQKVAHEAAEAAAREADDAAQQAAASEARPSSSRGAPLRYGGDPYDADLYRRLGVPRNASADDIKNAYRRFARERHPDMVQQAEKAAAQEEFIRVKEAYDRLSNAATRAEYDGLGDAARRGAAEAAADAKDVVSAREAYKRAVDAMPHNRMWTPEQRAAQAAYTKLLRSELEAARSIADPVKRFAALDRVFRNASERIAGGAIEDTMVDRTLARSIYKECEGIVWDSLSGSRPPPGISDWLHLHRDVMP